MAKNAKQVALLADAKADKDGTVFINSRCQVRTQAGVRVVMLAGIPLHYYATGDRMAEAYAMVSLVEQGIAQQNEVARAFGRATRSVRRYQERFAEAGLAALGRGSGYPMGRPRLTETRRRLVNDLKAKGCSNRQIAGRLGISEKAVRKRLRRLGWRNEAPEPEQLSLGGDLASGADPNLSAPEPTPLTSTGDRGPKSPLSAGAPADPNLSASAFSADDAAGATELSVPSLDADPADRRLDRLMAHLGLLMDAQPRFRTGTRVPGAGVLLAIPALLKSGVLEAAHEVYGSLGPSFYGLRTTIVTLLLMALLRIKRPEGLKERSPEDLGRIIGLDRAPEVKTVRRKLKRLALRGRSTELGRVLAKRRVETIGSAIGFLYADGHVRVYHGKQTIPKTHVARMRISLPATTDYWVNDAFGDPLFVVSVEANAGLVKMLPEILGKVRTLVGERRVTIVFDRGGWSPKLFADLIASGFDILTYRKGKCRKLSQRRFQVQRAVIDGHKVEYTLADQGVFLLKGKLRLRQVTRLAEDGHQTQIITSRRDLDAIEVAFRMFERWRQENFFKYLREEYAIDALVDYQVEPADAEREVPNPLWNALDAKLCKARAEVRSFLSHYGGEAFTNVEKARRTMRGFKIANAPIGKAIELALRRYIKLQRKRDAVPKRVPVAQVVGKEVVKLATERKHLTSLIKMVAYQAESDLLRMIAPHYKRVEDEGRTLLQTALASAADIDVSETELLVRLAPLSSAHRSRAVAAVCAELNQNPTRFPGTNLRLRFSVASQK